MTWVEFKWKIKSTGLTFLHKLITFNNKLNNFLILPQHINCNAFILPRVIECRVYYIKPPAMTQFRNIISQWAFHFCPGHRRLWVATGRAVKRSRMVLSHCLCVRRYNRYWKRNRFSRITLQSHHSSGPHCTCWGYCNIIQLQVLRCWTIWFFITSVGGQYETNLAIWLATLVGKMGAGKMGLSCPFGISRNGPARK